MEKHVLREMSDYSTLQIMNIPDAHWFWHSIRMYWVRSAFTDCGMLSSIFLITCRYIAKVYREPSLMYYILKYKSDCLGHLRIAVKSEIQRGVSNLTITKTLLLALDEVSDRYPWQPLLVGSLRQCCAPPCWCPKSVLTVDDDRPSLSRMGKKLPDAIPRVRRKCFVPGVTQSRALRLVQAWMAKAADLETQSSPST